MRKSDIYAWIWFNRGEAQTIQCQAPLPLGKGVPDTFKLKLTVYALIRNIAMLQKQGLLIEQHASLFSMYDGKTWAWIIKKKGP
jgi:hypothetical protein